MSDTKEINPKEAIGITKIPLALLSPIAEAEWALAQFCGDCKYQQWNWRASHITLGVYISAAKRHLSSFAAGETHDPRDHTHHLGNVMACCAIILDAMAAGTAIDDRAPYVNHRPAWDDVERRQKLIAQQYSHIPRSPYTILNTIVQPVVVQS